MTSKNRNSTNPTTSRTMQSTNKRKQTHRNIRMPIADAKTQNLDVCFWFFNNHPHGSLLKRLDHLRPSVPVPSLSAFPIPFVSGRIVLYQADPLPASAGPAVLPEISSLAIQCVIKADVLCETSLRTCLAEIEVQEIAQCSSKVAARDCKITSNAFQTEVAMQTEV